MSGFREIVESQPARGGAVGPVGSQARPATEAEPPLMSAVSELVPVAPIAALTPPPALPAAVRLSSPAPALIELAQAPAARAVLRAVPPSNGVPLPAGLSPRTFAVLRLVGLVGPAPFALLERLAPILVEGLAGKRSARRLLYRELERAQRSKLVVTRRLPLATAGVYAVSAAGAGLLRAHDAADVPTDALDRYLTCPDHEAGLRQIRAKLLLARFAPSGSGERGLRSLAFDDRRRFPLDGAHSYEPDGFYELGLGDGSHRVLVMEFDRTTKPLGAWADKLSKCAVALASSGPSARLLVVALAPRRLATLLEVAAEVLGPARERLRGIVLDQFIVDALWRPVFMASDGRAGARLFV